MISHADVVYAGLLEDVLNRGQLVTTRNSETFSNPFLGNTRFTSFPLVTIRKPAVKKALKEMEWFLSGEAKCPEKLSDWWANQLNQDNHLLYGYSEQFRKSTFSYTRGPDDYDFDIFDQVGFILNGLKNNPNSRRLLISLWNPGEMANITRANDNQNTPTCCHSIIIQFFVRNNELHIKTYQRSADMLLGVPHNWIQSWAMLNYFAFHSGLDVGSMTWMWGDAHIYKEDSHLEAAKQISNAAFSEPSNLLAEVDLEYSFSGQYDNSGIPVFLAQDFKVVGCVPKPVVTIRPKLL